MPSRRSRPSSRSTRAASRPVPRGTASTMPRPRATRPTTVPIDARCPADEATGLHGGNERSVAGAGPQQGAEPFDPTGEERPSRRADGGHRTGGIGAAHGAQDRRPEVDEPARSRQAAPGDHGDVGREVRGTEVGRRPAGAAGVDPVERELPRRPARRQEARLRGDVDEPLDPGSQPSSEHAGELHLEAAREDHVPAAYDTRLERGALEPERDHERRRRGGGRLHRRSVARSGGRRLGDDDQQRRSGDRGAAHAIVSRRTSTGVP